MYIHKIKSKYPWFKYGLSVVLACVLVFESIGGSYAIQVLEPAISSAPTINKSELVSPEMLVAHPELLSIPFDYVSLKEMHVGTNGKFLILIQDAHANASAQGNLASAIEQIADKYHIYQVFVEGSSHEVTLDNLRPLASKQDWNIGANRMLSEGIISGEEYLNLTSELPIKLLGIEYQALYDDCLQAYADLVGWRKDIFRYLRLIRQAVEMLKKRLYTEDILEYEALTKSEASTSQQFWKALIQLAIKVGVFDTDRYQALSRLTLLEAEEKNIHFDLVNSEMNSLLRLLSNSIDKSEFEELKNIRGTNDNTSKTLAKINRLIAESSKLGEASPSIGELEHYRDYLKHILLIEPDLIFREMFELEDVVYRTVLKNESGRQLRVVDRYLGLLKEAYEIKMSSTRFQEYILNEPVFESQAWQAFLNAELVEYGLAENLVPLAPWMKEAAEALKHFYQLVAERDDAFIQNSNRMMQDRNDPIGIMIVGGYHTENITRILREQGSTYVVLTPQVEFETDHSAYEKILFMGLQQKGLTLSSNSSTQSETVEDRNTLRKMGLETNVGIQIAKQYLPRIIGTRLPVPSILEALLALAGARQASSNDVLKSESVIGDRDIGLKIRYGDGEVLVYNTEYFKELDKSFVPFDDPEVMNFIQQDRDELNIIAKQYNKETNQHLSADDILKLITERMKELVKKGAEAVAASKAAELPVIDKIFSLKRELDGLGMLEEASWWQRLWIDKNNAAHVNGDGIKVYRDIRKVTPQRRTQILAEIAELQRKLDNALIVIEDKYSIHPSSLVRPLINSDDGFAYLFRDPLGKPAGVRLNSIQIELAENGIFYKGKVKHLDQYYPHLPIEFWNLHMPIGILKIEDPKVASRLAEDGEKKLGGSRRDFLRTVVSAVAGGVVAGSASNILRTKEPTSILELQKKYDLNFMIDIPNDLSDEDKQKAIHNLDAVFDNLKRITRNETWDDVLSRIPSLDQPRAGSIPFKRLKIDDYYDRSGKKIIDDSRWGYLYWEIIQKANLKLSDLNEDLITEWVLTALPDQRSLNQKINEGTNAFYNNPKESLKKWLSGDPDRGFFMQPLENHFDERLEKVITNKRETLGADQWFKSSSEGVLEIEARMFMSQPEPLRFKPSINADELNERLDRFIIGSVGELEPAFDAELSAWHWGLIGAMAAGALDWGVSLLSKRLKNSNRQESGDAARLAKGDTLPVIYSISEFRNASNNPLALIPDARRHLLAQNLRGVRLGDGMYLIPEGELVVTSGLLTLGEQPLFGLDGILATDAALIVNSPAAPILLPTPAQTRYFASPDSPNTLNPRIVAQAARLIKPEANLEINVAQELFADTFSQELHKKFANTAKRGGHDVVIDGGFDISHPNYPQMYILTPEAMRSGQYTNLIREGATVVTVNPVGLDEKYTQIFLVDFFGFALTGLDGKASSAQRFNEVTAQIQAALGIKITVKVALTLASFESSPQAIEIIIENTIPANASKADIQAQALSLAQVVWAA